MSHRLSAFIISMIFNAYWLLCVLQQSSAWPILTMILLAAIVYDRSVIWVAPIIAFIGLSIDGLLTGLGIFIFPQEFIVDSFALRMSTTPLWLVFLWLGFGAYTWLLRDLLLKYSILLMSVLFAISGAMSYYTAVRLGAVDFFDELTVTILLLFIWFFYGLLFTYIVKLFATKILINAKPLIRSNL